MSSSKDEQLQPIPGDPSNMPGPRLVRAFTLAIQFGPRVDVGMLGTGGRRSHVPIDGGRIEGDRLRGLIVGGHGGQLMLERSDCISVVVLSCVVRTSDGHVLWLSGQGYRVGEARGQGETAMTLYFEADEQGPYAWLGRTAFVACSSAGLQSVLDVAAIW